MALLAIALAYAPWWVWLMLAILLIGAIIEK
jgi:hypothetical protein